MKISYIKWLLPALLPALFLVSTGCGDDDPVPEPPVHEEETEDLAQAIKGTWISATDSENWIQYEFTESGRIKVLEMRSGVVEESTAPNNFYSVNKEFVSGSYTSPQGKTIYIDWRVKDVAKLEIKLDLYDNNTYLGNMVLNRVLTTISLEGGASDTPKYTALAGTKSASHYCSLNENVAAVDSETGEIKGVAFGTTYVFFDTEEGAAAVNVTVTSTPKALVDIIKGTWIYDMPSDKEWQKAIFADNNYCYVEWTNAYTAEIEHADGTYSVKDNNTVLFSVKTPYGMQINQEWVVTEMNDLSLKYNVYSEGESIGAYIAQKPVGAVSIDLGETLSPDYATLLPDVNITSYKVHDPAVATVSATGEIQTVSVGRTYIDLVTPLGTPVLEVTVAQTVIEDLWPDYSTDLGLTKEEIKAKYPERTINDSMFFFSLADDGSNDYTAAILFWVDDSKKVYTVEALLKEGADLTKIYNFLAYKYDESPSSSPEDKIWYFYKKDENGKNVASITLFDNKVKYSKID